MTCPNCGAALAGGSAFCPMCGRQTGDQTASTVAIQTPMRSADPSAQTVAIQLDMTEDTLFQQVRETLSADYEVESELGRGGMAVVFRAKERQLNRIVALKVVTPEMSGAAETGERFRREARLAAALEHPNILPIFRVGQAGNLIYMAMKFVEGRGLDSIVEQQGAALGNTVTGSTASVTLEITGGTGTTGAHRLGTLTVAAVNGVATFDGLSLDSVGTGYKVTATASGLTSATSNAFNRTP